MLNDICGEYEVCVCCNAKVDVLKEERVENRKYYICGVGQICEQCFWELQAQMVEENAWKREKEMQELLRMCAEEENDGLAKEDKIR